MQKLLLVDGSSLLHRAFYALPLLRNKSGQYTNGVHGFMMMFNKMLNQQKPDYVVVCFDKSRITFRNQIAADYKGTRKETPPELSGQFELIKNVLDAAGITWLEMAGYEADDLLGTLDKRAGEAGMLVEIFSGDRDILQLVDDNTTVYMTKKGITDIERWDAARVQEKYQLTPQGLIELKALMGDSSDNISGVPGVGEKTALKLLAQFGSVEQMYEHLDELENAKLRQKLLDHKEAALTSHQLATICCNAPLEIQFSDYQVPHEPTAELRALYEQLELRQLLKALGPQHSTPVASGAAVAEPAPQVKLSSWPKLYEEIAKTNACSLYATWQGPAAQGQLQSLAVACGKKVALWSAEDAIFAELPQALTQILADHKIYKTTAQAKEIRLLLAARQLAFAGLRDDVVIAAYLLDPAAGDYKLPELCSEYSLPVAAADDVPGAALTLADLAQKQRQKLTENELLALYEDIELPLTQVLADMEHQGIRVEGDKLSEMSALLEKSAATYQSRIFELAGREFNLNSPQQLGVVLFEELGLPPLKKTKTGYSTNAEVLETLAGQFEICRLILDYRFCFKLKSTYTDGLRPLIGADGKIHTSFNQTITATGRLSSTEPNLQNIPIRQELGRQIRTVFTADQPQDLLLSADYNQIELRILAHISQDAGLQEAFIRGEDIHTRTAAEVLNIPVAEVDANARRQAKAVNFGIVYGISDYGLSRGLDISRDQAHAYIEKYFARYPGVARYQQEIIENGKRDGYVSTMFGRRRWLPDLRSPNFNTRSFAQRMAINTPIQGSAADIIKLAMLNIDQRLQADGMRSRMILQVHDELIFNMVPEEQDTLPTLVQQLMEEAVSISVPLTVDAKVGRDWYHMTKI